MGSGYSSTSPGRGTYRGSGVGRIGDKIRFTVANKPAFREIPFEIERIPLPFGDQALSLASDSNQKKLLPVLEHLENAGAGRQKTQVPTITTHSNRQSDKNVSKWFDVDWSSISYSKTLKNTEVTNRSKGKGVSEELRLFCKTEILQPELVIGACSEPVIEMVVDGKDQYADISRARPRASRLKYRTPPHRQKLTMPSALAQWEGKTRLAMGLPLAERNKPQFSSELRPVAFSVKLDPGMVEQDQREVGLVKGSFNALTAESLKHVRVPFKASAEWVRLTDEVEIQVAQVWHDGFTNRYKIKERWRGGDQGGSLINLSQLLNPVSNRRSNFSTRQSRRSLFTDDTLPKSIVVSRQFIRVDGEPMSKYNRSGGKLVPAPIGGEGSIEADIEAIDFLIAEGLAYQDIPFEFNRIPLPKP